MVVAAVRMLVEPGGAQESSTSADRQVNWQVWLPRALGVGAVVGFLTGLFGVGGGFLIVPALLLLLRLEMPVAVGTSLVIVVINAVAGLVAHLPEAAQLNYPVVAVFTGAALVTAGSAGRSGLSRPVYSGAMASTGLAGLTGLILAFAGGFATMAFPWIGLVAVVGHALAVSIL